MNHHGFALVQRLDQFRDDFVWHDELAITNLRGVIPFSTGNGSLDKRQATTIRGCHGADAAAKREENAI